MSFVAARTTCRSSRCFRRYKRRERFTFSQPAGLRPSRVNIRSSSSSSSSIPKWRPASVLDEWVQREARPISLRQLTVFGRSLTEARLLSSANYVRTELPIRLSHRLRDMQTLPYIVISNPHWSFVYEKYWTAFDVFRKVPEIKTSEDNDRFCKIIRQTLREHMSVIPRLVMGVLETQDLMKPESTDKIMNTLLKARISRRVIAEQHLALTDTFHSAWHFPDSQPHDSHGEFIGEVFLRVNAKELVDRCATAIQLLARQAYGTDVQIPKVEVVGHLDATLTYIPSHLEYMIGELLRNSMQAVVEQRGAAPSDSPPPSIEVLICEAPQHVIFRVSDQGGGLPQNLLPNLWSFVKKTKRDARLQNLNKVPKLAATLQDFKVLESIASNPHSGGISNAPEQPNGSTSPSSSVSDGKAREDDARDSTAEDTGDRSRDEVGNSAREQVNDRESLITLAGRPPNLRLGIGLPMARVFAEYWAGSLELHNLEGYGVDAFLQVSKLGNKNEQLTTRASMDSL